MVDSKKEGREDETVDVWVRPLDERMVMSLVPVTGVRQSRNHGLIHQLHLDHHPRHQDAPSIIIQVRAGRLRP